MINFTEKIEIDKKISSLYNLMERTSDHFNTFVYRKNTFAGLGLSFMIYYDAKL